MNILKRLRIERGLTVRKLSILSNVDLSVSARE
jgi:hypothetical protein